LCSKEPVVSTTHAAILKKDYMWRALCLVQEVRLVSLNPSCKRKGNVFTTPNPHWNRRKT
jgi:hypothetical protein